MSITKVLWLACVFLFFLLSTEEFDYNKEERYECKGGEMFGNQRRFPGPIFWDYKVKLRIFTCVSYQTLDSPGRYFVN